MSKDNVIRPNQFQGPSDDGGGGGGTVEWQGLMKDYVDSRDDAIESRLVAKLDKLATKGTIWAALAAALGIIFAALAIAGDRFDSGLSVSPVMSQMQASQAATDREQNAKLQRVDDKLDILIKRSDQTQKPKS